jgi:hypothetical protein
MNPSAITGVVAMLEVSDVEHSSEFYQWLGFEVGNKDPATGKMFWAWLYSPKAPDWRRGPNLMLRRSEGEIRSQEQKVILYLYASELTVLRQALVDAGLTPSEISYPGYLPLGEFRLFDPDGYCLMIAQATSNTP